MIHWSTYIYFSFICVVLIFVLEDYFSLKDIFVSKRRYTVGFVGAVYITAGVVFTLIWGGIFWW